MNTILHIAIAVTLTPVLLFSIFILLASIPYAMIARDKYLVDKD